jgi:hypothetical protein
MQYQITNFFLGHFASQGPGGVMIEFCMATILATLILDDDVMQAIKSVKHHPCCLQSK